MKSPVSKTITEIKPSGIRKFFDIVNTMEDAISLGVGEPDFQTPWQIRRAGIASLQQGKTFYTSNWGLADLRKEIAKYFGVADSTITYWASLGMPVANIDGRKLYGKQSNTEWLKSHEMPSQKQNKKPVTMGVVKD